MTTTNARFGFRNFHDEGTVSASSEATDYEATNTQNSLRGEAWRSTSTSDATISVTLSRSRVVNYFAIFGHREHGGKVRFEGFTDAAWSTPATGGDSTALDVNKIVGSSSDVAFASGDDPYGIGQYDPFIVESPYWYYFASDVTLRSYRITFSNHSTTFWNDAYHHVERIMVGKYWSPSINPTYDGFGKGRRDNTEIGRSRGGARRSNKGAKWAVCKLQFNGVSETEAPVWEDGIDHCLTAGDIFVSLFPGDGTRLERDNTKACHLSGLDVMGRAVSRLTNTLQLEER